MLAVTELTAVRNDKRLFEPISFELAAHQLLQINGANGIGKSTLLRILAGLYPIQVGQISFHSQQPLSQQVFYLGHQHFLSMELTVLENLQYFAYLRGHYRLSLIIKALKSMKIEDLAHIPVKKLSFGQQKRASLCCGLIMPVWLWILDEPLVGLDRLSLQCFMKVLTNHMQDGGSAIIATHELVKDIQSHSIELLPAQEEALC